MRSGAKGLAAFALAAAFCVGSALAEKPRRVLRVADGDTLTTREDGTVRLLGYDSPEMGHRARCPREAALAVEARDWIVRRTRGGVLLREATDDRGRRQPDRDRYGRLLRKGFAPDGGDLAAELIEHQLAVPYWGRGPRKDWCRAGG